MSYRGFHSQADYYDFNRKLEREYALIEEAEERDAKERARAYYDRDGSDFSLTADRRSA